MTGGGRKTVLAMLIRQARQLEPGWKVHELIAGGVIASAPQSIQGIRERGAEWIRARLTG